MTRWGARTLACVVGLFFLACGACGSPPVAPPPAPLAAADAGAPEPSAATSAARAPDAGPADPCEGEEFGLRASAEADAAARVAKKRGSMGTATRQMVASSHRLATEAGLAVLRAGGNAADAFIAATLVQDVVLPGVTSTAGLAGVLVYEARTKAVTYVHGGVADPIDPARRYRPGDSAAGKLVLVPGAPGAYVAVARLFGKKPFAQLVEPAAKLAASGFPLDGLYARSIAGHHLKLEKSAYGKKTFFRNGKPLAQGETLVLAELAKSLRAFGRDPTFFYRGAWPREAVSLANASGGTLTVKDFETYVAEIATAMHASYMGDDVYAAGHGGAKVLVSLGAIERLRRDAGNAPPRSVSTSADALEMLLRVQRATDQLPMLADRELVGRGDATSAELPKAADGVAAMVRAQLATPGVAGPGTHSSAVIVVDSQGNIVIGTHTIETLNWGEGLFVGGVPLSTSASVAFDDAAKATKRMRIDPLSNTLVMHDGAPRAALAVYGTGLHPADVQILDAVIARGLDAEDAVLEPRVGYYALDISTMKMDASKNTVDPRFDRSLLCTVKGRGFGLLRSMAGTAAGFVDTGFPTLVTFAPGKLHGMTPDPSHIEGVAAGD